jgi:hypothetical protein
MEKRWLSDVSQKYIAAILMVEDYATLERTWSRKQVYLSNIFLSYFSKVEFWN